MQNYYQILGVPEDATSTCIRDAYLKILRQIHPDLNRNSNAESFLMERFIETARAYSVLIDPEKRACYDTDRAAENRRVRSDEKSGDYERKITEALESIALYPERTLNSAAEAIQLFPGRAEAYIVSAKALIRMKSFDTAQACLIQAKKIQPMNPEIYYLFGICRFETGQLKTAALQFQHAFELDRSNPGYAALLSAVYSKMKNFIKSSEYWEYLRLLDPGNDLLWMRYRILLGLRISEKQEGNTGGCWCAVCSIINRWTGCF